MECRYINLCHTLAGYKATGVPLLAFNGQTISACTPYDDLGLYFIIPKLAVFFNLSLNSSLELFFFVLTWGCWFIGAVGFFFLYRSWLARFIAWSGLWAISFYSVDTVDVYRAYTFAPLALISWALYCEQHKHVKSFIMVHLLAGMLIGFSHYLRAHAGSALIIFLMVLLITAPYLSWIKKLIIGIALATGLALPFLYFHQLIKNTQKVLPTYLPHYYHHSVTHPFWHQLYIGLGFLATEYITTLHSITWNDACAKQRAKALNSQIPDYYPSVESEQLLRKELYRLATRYPLCILRTLWAKGSIIFLYFIWFMSIGLFALALHPLPWRLHLAFIATLLFNALFGLLALPINCYLLGFITCTALYSIASINYALEHPSHLKSLLLIGFFITIALWTASTMRALGYFSCLKHYFCTKHA
jgi:hypothetical protein